jgi:hypothetical protein
MLKDKESKVVIHANHGLSLSSLRRLWPASRTGNFTAGRLWCLLGRWVGPLENL